MLRARGEDEPTVLVADTGSAATVHTDGTATQASAVYAYRVKAIRDGELSQASNEARVQLPPGVLRSVSSSPSHDQVVLTWDDPGDDAITGYRILRRDHDNNPDGDFATLVADTGSVETGYTDTTVEPERSYAYRVHAISAHGTGPPSHDVLVQTPAAPTTEPATESTAGTESVSEGDTDLPNDNSTPGRVAVGGSATGDIDSAFDTDRFRVDLEAGKTYRFDLEGEPTGGGTLEDSFLGLYDGSGTSLTDDDSGENLNSRITHTPATGGAYYLVAAAADGFGTGTYTLSVRDVTPPEAGNPPPPGTGQDEGPGQSVSEGDTDLPNDNSTHGRVAVGGSATGTIGTDGDQDRFAVELEAGRTYRFDLTGSPGGGGTLPDTYFRAIYDSEGRYQADSYNDDFEGGPRQPGYVHADGERDVLRAGVGRPGRDGELHAERDRRDAGAGGRGGAAGQADGPVSRQRAPRLSNADLERSPGRQRHRLRGEALGARRQLGGVHHRRGGHGHGGSELHRRHG